MNEAIQMLFIDAPHECGFHLTQSPRRWMLLEAMEQRARRGSLAASD
jgi:hypothetical protein